MEALCLCMLNTHTHTHVVAVCVAMAAGCCSDVVETLQPHTAPNVPALPLAGRNHMGTQQPIGWEEHFV